MSAESTGTKDFIRKIVEKDLASGYYERIKTRFPPEPSGYLHIGHAKAACVSYEIAREYGGLFGLRMDDTNPLKTKARYVQAIQEDIRWLGLDWGDRLTYASDNFERLYEIAEQLIRQRDAYVDTQTQVAIRMQRGDFTHPGEDSPFRNRPTEESLAFFRAMKAGQHAQGECVLRAKISMKSPNMNLRDPVLYRIIHAEHPRAKANLCLYPMYDYAHCLCDAFEGITHSLCSLEFADNRALYKWILDKAGINQKPKQIEFSRLNLAYTITSKRILGSLINQGWIEGWDDPRLPTLTGLRRLGVPAQAIRAFSQRTGVTRKEHLIEMGSFDHNIHKDLEDAPRVFAVLDPIKLIVDNYPEGRTETLTAPSHPQDPQESRKRTLTFGPELWIDRADFALKPSKDYKRLAKGVDIRLRYGYIVRCGEAEVDASGQVVAVHCTYYENSCSGKDSSGIKPQGIIHWLGADDGQLAQVRLYEPLLSVPVLTKKNGETDADIVNQLRPPLRFMEAALIERQAFHYEPRQAMQFERLGYFVRDEATTDSGRCVFHRTIPLKSGWKFSNALKSALEKVRQGDHKGALADYDKAIEIDPENADLYFNRGNAKHALGDDEGALADYDKALELNPEHSNAYINRGATKDALGDYEGALADYDKALEINPSSALMYSNRGNAKHALGDDEGALADYDKAIEINPMDALAYFNRGAAKGALGDDKGALADYDKALEIDPSNALIYNNRGNTKGALDDYEGALADYDKALEINPEYVNAYNNRGAAKGVLGDYKGALADYDKALEINPEHAGAYNNRGAAKYALNRANEAIADYGKALEIDPSDAGAYNNRGTAKRALGDYEGALADCDKAIEIDPSDAGAYNNRGTAKRALGDYKGALADYDKGLEINPSNANAYNNRGTAKYALKRIKEAIADYDKALEINPEYALAYNNRGAAKYALKRTEEAIADYDKALEINPEYAGAYNNRGNAKHALGDYEGALADCDKALEINPEHADAYNNRGTAKYALKRPEEAIADYEKALEINPEYANAYNNRGLVKHALGDYEDRLADYNKALEINPEYALAYNNRGITKRALGDHKGALADYDKAIDIGPEHADAYSNRGTTKRALGDYQGALADYDKAIEINPQHAPSYFNRGNTKGARGDYKDALTDYDKAIEINPSNALMYSNRGAAKYALGDTKAP